MAVAQVVTVLSTPVEPILITGSVATVPVSVAFGTLVATVSGTATVTQQAVSYAFVQTGIATIKATAGTLYQAVMSGVATAGTVTLLNSAATVVVIVMVANDTRQVSFGPGVAFGTLIATVVGTVNLTVVYQ